MRFSLAAKFNLLVISLAAICVIAMGGFLVDRAYSEQRRGRLEHARELAETVAQQSSYAIYTRDRVELRQLLERLSADPDAVYALIMDAGGEVLASQVLREGLAVPAARLDGEAAWAPTQIVELADPDGQGHYADILVPVRSVPKQGNSRLLAELRPGAQVPRVIGYLQFGVDDRRWQAPRESFVVSAIAFGSAALVLVAAATLFLTQRITSPVRRLAALTRDISGGQFDQNVDVSTRDEVGELAGALGVMLERLREYRDQVKEHQLTLEAQVEQRTLELRQRTEEAYELARQAQAANRAKSQFLANMSHEIRTPMNGVLGMTELLLESKQSSKQRRFTKTVHQSARDLLALIDDILDFSRAEAGKLELDPSAFDLRASVEDLVDLLADQAHRKGLELACFIEDDVPRQVRADSGRLRQILTNLVGNAVKFTEKGEVVVRVTRVSDAAPSTSHDREEGRCALEFTVTDSGIGISEEAKDRIFQHFSQADGSMARRFGGTGLGLAICKQLVGLMGGEIGVETEEGVGSRFWFRICIEALGEDDIEAGRDGVRSPSSESGPKRHVLVVDSNATSASITAHHLRSWGAMVAVHADGKAALRALGSAASRGTPFEIVIFDVAMAGMGAADFICAIRRDAPIPTPRLLALIPVGATLPPEVEREMETPLHLAKPTRKQDLHRAFAAAFGEQVPLSEMPAGTPGSGATFAARVLLAEDNEVNQEVAVAMLGALGCQVVVANNGREAVEAAAREAFDLVFMDCQMPEMDGFAATREIRRREAAAGPKAARLPIVALTAHAMRTDREDCLAVGMDDYLTKPFTKDSLGQVIAKWVGDVQETPQKSEPDEVDQGRGREEASPSSDAEEVLDSSTLDKLRALEQAGAAGLLSRVVDAYLQSSDKLERAIRDAVSSGDPEAMARAAHALKSSSGQVGARRLFALCKDLEALGRAGSVEGAPELRDQIFAELEAAKEALVAEQFGARDE